MRKFDLNKHMYLRGRWKLKGAYSAGNEEQWGRQRNQGDKYEQRSRIYVYEGVKVRLIMRQLSKLIKEDILKCTKFCMK